MATFVTVSVTMLSGDNIWDRLKRNDPGLGYSEQELVDSPELFVWIMANNGLQNLRRVPPKSLSLPPRSSLGDVIAEVRADPNRYPTKFFQWVKMDRCIDVNGNPVPEHTSHASSGTS